MCHYWLLVNRYRDVDCGGSGSGSGSGISRWNILWIKLPCCWWFFHVSLISIKTAYVTQTATPTAALTQAGGCTTELPLECCCSCCKKATKNTKTLNWTNTWFVWCTYLYPVTSKAQTKFSTEYGILWNMSVSLHTFYRLGLVANVEFMKCNNHTEFTRLYPQLTLEYAPTITSPEFLMILKMKAIHVHYVDTVHGDIKAYWILLVLVTAFCGQAKIMTPLAQKLQSSLGIFLKGIIRAHHLRTIWGLNPNSKCPGRTAAFTLDSYKKCNKNSTNSYWSTILTLILWCQ